MVVARVDKFEKKNQFREYEISREILRIRAVRKKAIYSGFIKTSQNSIMLTGWVAFLNKVRRFSLVFIGEAMKREDILPNLRVMLF